MRRQQHSLPLMVSFLLLVCFLIGLAGNSSISAYAAPRSANALDVIINEVAWGGTAASQTDQWIELYNPTASEIDFSTGWKLVSSDNPPSFDVLLTGKIASHGYYLLERTNESNVSVQSDQLYTGPGNLLSSAGGSLLLYAPGANGLDLIDSANRDGGAWPGGDPTGFGSMERYGLYPDADNIWTTNPNPDPNSSTDYRGNPIYGTPRGPNWAETVTPSTITTITADTFDPSGTNQPVNVVVRVAGGPISPTGTVTITGADTNCTISSLSSVSAGVSTGNCDVIFTSIGNKTLTANYSGDADHLPSADNETHTVVLADATTTLITADTPEPSAVNQLVKVTVTVSGGTTKPTGTVNITGANTNCSIPLTGTGTGVATGSCNVNFSSVGSKTLTATYSGDATHLSSSDTETHDVLLATTTTITADSPDPSKTNQGVNVTVRVVGGTTKPTGTVSITGASSNCTLVLSANGDGTCGISFSTSGLKTITATYSGDSLYAGSLDTEFHSVSLVIATTRPTVIPPQPLVAINEFLPRPGHDWNNDGKINTGDEYIELLNHGVIDVNLGGYRLDDEANIGSAPFNLPSITIKPGQRIVFYGSETGLLLSDGGDGVRLLKSSGQLVDAYNYTTVGYPDQAFCRLPDDGGADDWSQTCYPTPGLRNSLGSFGTVNSTPVPDSLCPFADTAPMDFIFAECDPFGNNIWRPAYWDDPGWLNGQDLPNTNSKWEIFAD